MESFFSTAPIPRVSRFCWQRPACMIWRASASGGDELRANRQRDIPPPAIEIERRLNRRPFQRRYDPVGISGFTGIARDQHDGAAIDQFLEAGMMVEFVWLGRAGDNDGPAGLHAGDNAAAPSGKAFLERIAEGVDLTEQAEDLVI